MRKVLMVAALLALGAQAAAGQRREQARQGFTVALGLGAGTATLSCDDCEGDRETSATVRIMLGGAARPNLVLAGEIEGWSKEEDGETATLAWLNFVALWYPAVEQGFFVKAGVGAGGVTLESDTFSEKVESAGLGAVAGLGYDFRLGRNFSLTPFASYLFASEASAKVDGEDAGFKLGGNVLSFGLSATWH